MSSPEYPVSRVVKGIKEQTGEKQVSLKVKLATEQLLQDVTEIVAKDLERTTAGKKTINESDLRKVTKKFESTMHMEEEHDEMVKELEKIRDKLDVLIKDFKKKFGMKYSEDFYFKPTGKLAEEE